jgi:hypothetical protein
MSFILCFFFIIGLIIKILLQLYILHFFLLIFCIFAQAEITQLNMALIINEYIIRFQISMHIVQHMNLLNGQYLAINKDLHTQPDRTWPPLL